MRKSALYTLCIVLLSSSSFADQIRSYGGVTVGGVLPANGSMTDASGTSADVSYMPGYSLSGVVGHEFGLGLRLEGEVNYTKVDLDKIHTTAGTNRLNAYRSSIGVFANTYYDLMVSDRFTPYIGVGLGFKSVSMSSSIVNDTRLWNSGRDSVFAYQAGLGFGARLTRDMTFDMGYRYQGAGNSKIDQVSADSSSHNILIGIRYYP